MCHIGYVSFLQETENKYLETLGTMFDVVELEDKDNVINGHNQQLDAIIVQYDQNVFMGNVCEMIIQFREQTNALIWVISEEVTKVERRVFLRLGANGVYSSGIDSEELAVIIKNFWLCHSQKQKIPHAIDMKHETVISPEKFKLIPNSFSVVIEGEEIGLTKLEFQIISFLYEHIHEVVTYEEIYKEVWKSDEVNKAYRVSNIVFHLRKKLEKDELHPQYIKTIRSRGYMLNIE